jgi:iron only hydrogenase large subunit-like protein
MSKFSSALKLADLDDFITPSQNCVKPVKIEKKNDSKKVTKIEVSDGGDYVEVHDDGSRSVLQKTTISLNDCLACSGCITTAESVLVSAQSADEFLKHVPQFPTAVDQPATEAAPYLPIVISLSPQSRASIAVHYGLDIYKTHRKLKSFLSLIGIDYLTDTSVSRELSLLEMTKEFIDRVKTNTNVPLMTSACPGWICYAEKTHGDYILPYISTVKSPQQIMGAIVKNYLREKMSQTKQTNIADIYHVTVMPCYDKKLEASRDDFYDELLQTKEVDLVLTTAELTDVIALYVQRKQQSGTLPSDLTPRDWFVNHVPEMDIDVNQPEVHLVHENKELGAIESFSEGSYGAGGYLEYVFRRAAKELYNVDVTEIKYQQGRNPDFQEVNLFLPDKPDQPVLKFAACYGFRNIQNVLRAIKRNACKYQFIEVMACPGACLNGGGQIKVEGAQVSLQQTKQHLQVVQEKYKEQRMTLPSDNPFVRKLYEEWLGGEIGSTKAEKYLRTKYHAVAKLELSNPLAIKW